MDRDRLDEAAGEDARRAEERVGVTLVSQYRRHAIMRHLPYFVVVAEQEHFQRAAELLNMSQPALSRRIQDMEEELGVRLFERKRRGVILTTAGRMLRDDAARIMSAMDGAIHRLHAMARSETRHLRLSFNESALRNTAITASVEHFRTELPAVELEMLPLLTEAALAALQRRELDACFLYDYGLRQQGLNVMRITGEPLVLALPSDHPLLAKKTLRLRDLADLPMSWPSRVAGARLHERMAAAWAAAGLTPHVIMEVLTTDSTLSLAANHLALGFITATTPPAANVVYAPVVDFSLELDLSLVWLPDNDAPPLMRLVELVRERAGGLDKSGI